MMDSTRAAIEATRDNDGVVTFGEHHVNVEWQNKDVPLAADDLVRDNRFLISPDAGRERKFRVYRSR